MKQLIFIFALLLPLLLHADGGDKTKLAKLKESFDKALKVNISQLKEGQLLKLKWEGTNLPIFILRRNAEDIAYLKQADNSLLYSPNDEGLKKSILATNNSPLSEVYTDLYLAGMNIIDKHSYRSIDKNFFVFVGMDPTSRCGLNYTPGENNIKFSDLCSSRKYDVAGRLIKTSINQDATSSPLSNVYVVPYSISSKHVTIGRLNALDTENK